MIVSDSPCVEAALWYAQQQFGVFPVWSPNPDGSCRCPAGADCKQPGKHPIPATGFKAATIDEAKIRTFLAAASEPNIGITPPPGAFGWDVDNDAPLKLAELAKRLGPLPPTLTTISGNGMHLIFAWPYGVERPKGHPLGIVMRWADTGYLIGAGSRHASGAIYRFELGEDGRPRPIAELPMAWTQALLAYREPHRAPGQPGAKIREGGRHEFLRDKARHLRGMGLTGDALYAAVWALNLELCSPPKTADEVLRAIGEVETKFGPDSSADPEGSIEFQLRSEPWDPPLSLDRGADLPAFPVAGLPGWLQSFVLAEAEATQTPVDMAAMFVLAALATVVAGRVQIEPVAGWCETLNLFVAVAMEPGSRKSAVHRHITDPIAAHERLLVEQAQPDIAEQASIRRIAEASLARAEKAAASAKDRIERLALEDEARSLSAALDRLDVPVPPRIFTADVTPEKLASMLHENGGRMAVLSAEGGIFDIMAGRYSSGVPNIDVYLAGHAGDRIRVDRRGRPPEFVDRPALTICLALQPYVLAKAAHVTDFAGRGLLARFLYSIPAGTVGYRRTDAPPMPEAVRGQYDTTLRALAAAFETFAEPATLHLGIEASALFAAWRAGIEPRRRPDSDLGPIAAWSSKLDGAVARIAGLLHVATTFTSGWDTPITVATMAAAIEIGSYLIDHATAAFGLMAADPRLDAARRIGLWIVGNNKATFTQREAFRALRGQAIFSTVEGLTAGLNALEDHGWVRGVATERGPGRPSSRYAANPSILLKGWTKRPELTKTPVQSEVLSILSIDSEPDLGDWFEAPLPAPEEAATDEWGTIG
jgi:replicative DNA helicase